MRAWYLALLVPVAIFGFDYANHPANGTDSAKFIIEPEIVATNVVPFTATIGASGNGADLTGSGGFEPTVFRTLLRPNQDAADRIIVPQQAITNYDSWRSGVLDGADVEVLRVVDGKFVSVRTDRIRAGGHLASGWLAQFDGQVIPNDVTSVKVGWNNWNRLGAPYYYTVKAVDWMGRLSSPANSVSVIAPAKPTMPPNPTGLSKRELKDETTAVETPQALIAVSEADGSATLTWSKVPDAAGYVVYRSDMPPEEHKGYALLLEGQGTPIKAGDMVFLRKRFMAPDSTNLLTNRLWATGEGRSVFGVSMVGSEPTQPNRASWTLREHEVGSQIIDGGQSYLEANLEPARPFEIGRYNHSGTAQTWYEVLDPRKRYIAEVWLRGDKNVSAKFIVRGPIKYIKGLPARLHVTNQWQRHKIEFQVSEIYDGAQAGWMGVWFEGKGRVDIDNFRIYREDAGYLNWLPEDLAELKRSAMGGLRTHGFIKTGRHTYDLAQLTNGAGASSVASGNTLPQTLELMRSAQVNPWLQIEPHFSKAEWLGLVEYLAAPYVGGQDQALKPWAAKRAAQGHVSPYTDDFHEIHFEIGNETWNGLFAPWTFESMLDAENGRRYSSGEVYGLYQSYVLSILKSSPYWEKLKDKLVPVIGGWAINSYGEDAARMSPETPLVTYAAYNGGWDEGEGVVTDTPAGRSSVLSSAIQAAWPRAEMHNELIRKAARARGSPISLGTYEAGPGYQMNGLNGATVSPEQKAVQEAIMKGPIGGVATLDTFLTLVRAGHKVQNYFTFGRGDYWKSHAKWYQGGKAYPSWSWLSTVNRFAASGAFDLLKVKVTEVPQEDFPAVDHRPAASNVHLVDIFPFRTNQGTAIFIVSRADPLTSFNDTKNINIRIDVNNKKDDFYLQQCQDSKNKFEYVPSNNKELGGDVGRFMVKDGVINIDMAKGTALCVLLKAL